MKLVSTVLLSLSCVAVSLSQEFNLNFGKCFSTFIYKDANGLKDEAIAYRVGNTYGASFGVGLGAKSTLRPEVFYSEMGAKSSDVQLPVEWKLNYLGLGASYLIDALTKENIRVSPGLAFGMDYLLKGEQTIGTDRYNLNEDEVLKPWNLNASAMLNTRFMVTETFAIFMEYRYSIGLNQIEKQDIGEKTRNIAHRALVGLSFNL